MTREVKPRYPTTPDGRYFVVKRKLWRCTNPSLPEALRKELVARLMTARRSVKSALRSGDVDELRKARAEVHRTKVELGERGPVWWTDGSPDQNRRSVDRSSYSEWFSSLDRDESGSPQMG